MKLANIGLTPKKIIHLKIIQKLQQRILLKIKLLIRDITQHRFYAISLIYHCILGDKELSLVIW